MLSHLKYLLETKGSAVVCVAEGAGQVSYTRYGDSIYIYCYINTFLLIILNW